MRLLGVLLLSAAFLPGCIGPSGWDARTDGGRRDPGPDDPSHSGQPGVEDLRSGAQNNLKLRLTGRANPRE